MRMSVSNWRFLTIGFILILMRGNHLRIPFFVILFFTGHQWWWLTAFSSLLWFFQVRWWGYQIIVFWWFLSAVSMFKLCMANKRCRRTVNFVTTFYLTKELWLKFIFLSSDSPFLLFLFALLDFKYFIKKHGHHLLLLTGFTYYVTKLFISLH